MLLFLVTNIRWNLEALSMYCSEQKNQWRLRLQRNHARLWVIWLSIHWVVGAVVDICTAKASAHKEPESPRLFIRGIPTNIKEEELLKFFNSVGEVILHIFPRDRNNGLLRNFCFITYRSPELVLLRTAFYVDPKVAEWRIHDVQWHETLRRAGQTSRRALYLLNTAA